MSQRTQWTAVNSAIRSSCTDVIYHLLKNEPDCHIAYERDGCWDIGMGSQAQIALLYAEAVVGPADLPGGWAGANRQQQDGECDTAGMCR